MAKQTKGGRPIPSNLDPLIHERLRLGIVSALAMHESFSFTELRDLLQTTDGNLSVQARRLEDAGYVTCSKRFEDRRPKSTYRLTGRGRTALLAYLETLAEVLPPVARVRQHAPARPHPPRPVFSHG